MIIYTCDCGEYKETPHTGKASYVLRDGKLVLNNIPYCPHCKKQLSYREENNEELDLESIGIGKFQGMSDSQKKEALRKRSKQLGKKDGSAEMKHHQKMKMYSHMLRKVD